jgi:hypothetical protein
MLNGFIVRFLSDRQFNHLATLSMLQFRFAILIEGFIFASQADLFIVRPDLLTELINAKKLSYTGFQTFNGS